MSNKVPQQPADTSPVDTTTHLKERRSVVPLEHSTFRDIQVAWESLDNDYYLLEDDEQSKNTMKCIKESENAHISFLQYMQRFRSLFNEEKIMIAFRKKDSATNKIATPYDLLKLNNKEEMLQQPEINYYGTAADALLNFLKSEKALGDRIANVDIRRTQEHVQSELEVVKVEKDMTTFRNKIQRSLFKFSVCFGGVIFVSTDYQVPRLTAAIFFGAIGFTIGITEYVSFKTLEMLELRIQILSNLQARLIELQNKSSTFRSCIRDLIIDIQHVKLMEGQHKEGRRGVEELTQKLKTIQNEAMKNERFIKHVTLDGSPPLLIEANY